MKKKIIAVLILALTVCAFCFTACAAPQKVKLSVEKKSYLSLGNVEMQITVTANAEVKQALTFYYTVYGEVYEGVMQAGTKKAYALFSTPHTEASRKIDFALVPSDDYTLGNQEAVITLIPDPVFKMGKGGVTVTPAGDGVSVVFEVTNKKILPSPISMRLQDAEGNVLDTKSFSKDYPRATFRFTVPKNWTGKNPIALWYGDRKVSDDYLIIIRKNDTVVRSIETDSKKVVITVDCGAGTTYHLRKWLDLMDKYNVKATFFMTGYFLENNPTAAAEVLARGHDVGNHSMTHQKLSNQKFDVVSEEIETVNRLIYEQTDGYVPEFFRAPYGSWSYSMNTMVDHLGMETIQWSASSGDSAEGVKTQEIYRNVTGKHLQPGAIFLFHNATPGMNVMDDVFEYYTENGYEMVSLSMLMPEEYVIDGNGVVHAAGN